MQPSTAFIQRYSNLKKIHVKLDEIWLASRITKTQTSHLIHSISFISSSTAINCHCWTGKDPTVTLVKELHPEHSFGDSSWTRGLQVWIIFWAKTRMQNLNDVVMFHLSSHEFLSNRCMSTNVHPWSFPFAFKHFLAFKVSRINLSITSESTKRRMHSYGILWNPPIFSNWIKS